MSDKPKHIEAKTVTPPASYDPTSRARASSAADWVHIDDVIPWKRNPRTLSGDALESAMESLRRWGWCAPCVGWEERQRLVAGHSRIEALRAILGADPQLIDVRNAKLRASLSGPSNRHVPLRWRSFASDEEADAYALRDNNPMGAWDKDELVNLLAELPDDLVEAAGFLDPGESSADEAKVFDVTSDMNSEFVVSVRGPLRCQPDVLERIRSEFLKIDPELEVQVIVV